jgi:hypothetical protein
MKNHLIIEECYGTMLQQNFFIDVWGNEVQMQLENCKTSKEASKMFDVSHSDIFRF